MITWRKNKRKKCEKQNKKRTFSNGFKMVNHEEETCIKRWLAIFNLLLGMYLVYTFFCIMLLPSSKSREIKYNKYIYINKMFS